MSKISQHPHDQNTIPDHNPRKYSPTDWSEPSLAQLNQAIELLKYIIKEEKGCLKIHQIHKTRTIKTPYQITTHVNTLPPTGLNPLYPN